MKKKRKYQMNWIQNVPLCQILGLQKLVLPNFGTVFYYKGLIYFAKNCVNLCLCYMKNTGPLYLCQKKIVLVIKKNYQGWRLRICKFFEITRTIYSKSERSEDFLLSKCFFILFLYLINWNNSNWKKSCSL